MDWSSYYRIFSKERFDVRAIFNTIFKKGIELSPVSKYVVAHMDDTLVKKTGKKVYGASWRRDPLGPPFHTNFIWGQRFITLSLAIPEQVGIGPSRAIPIQFTHCPSARKPKATASAEEKEEYKKEYKQKNLNVYGSKEVHHLRNYMNACGITKQLVMCVDGSYTNATILKNIPENTSFIGRTRKDAKFHYPAINTPSKGRKKVYGERLPTPDEIRKSDAYTWQKVEAWAAGKTHEFKLKMVDGIIWRKTGRDQKYRLVIIQPLAYRLTKDSKLLYRKPAYLLCTDLEMSIQDTLQFYLWRWEIEVNIGEGKSKFGAGQAQVRNPKSVATLPAFIMAIYSLLLLAHLASAKSTPTHTSLPRPKWYPLKPNGRSTTGDLINLLKAQIYCSGIGINFSHFVNLQNKQRSARNVTSSMFYSDFYARA